MLTIAGARLVNQQSLVDAIVQAFKVWADEDIEDGYWDYQFLEREWEYDYFKPTIRGNKNVYPDPITSPRNIEDWGDLHNSRKYRFSVTEKGASAYWLWDAVNSSGKEYAWYVHEGAGTNRTARPFTDDISIPSSFWYDDPGSILKMRIRTALARLNAN